ncbi:MAG: hypothetical protein HXY41_00065 [Chloroflexi bacterium]|nr:hypothetical protein [Chloroflexota bacterium]
MSQRSPGTQFTDLMQAGRVALAAGKPQVAHDLWKEAAALDPYNEQVWLALLDVLQTDADRRVCLQNIIAINPLNVQARRQLNRIDARLERRQLQRKARQRQRLNWLRQRRRLFVRAVLLGIAIGLSGVLFGIVISILLYAL